MAITGNGGASKEQVALILKRVFCIKDENMLPYLDATDALGAAYCHFLQSINSLNVKGRNASWRDYKNNIAAKNDTGKMTLPQKKFMEALCRKSLK